MEVATPPETGDESAGDISAAVIVTKIYAGGICCPSEVPLITNILQPMPGVLEVRLCNCIVFPSFLEIWTACVLALADRMSRRVYVPCNASLDKGPLESGKPNLRLRPPVRCNNPQDWPYRKGSCG